MSTTVRIAIVSVVAGVTIVLAVVFSGRFGTDPKLSPSPLIGQPAPEVSFDVVGSDAVLSITDLHGDIVVVNFWAPWCVPCRQEHGELSRIAQEYGGFGVTVFGAVYQSREPDVEAFLDELGRDYPVGMDKRSRAAIEFGVRGVPETYFIDRDGTVVAKVAGAVDYDLASATIDRIVMGETVDAGRGRLGLRQLLASGS